MKYVTWNDPDPRAVWGNRNLRWGGKLLEPGDPGYVELQPGEPGYIPPAPEPRRKRALAISVESLNLPDLMQPFRYILYLIKGLFTSKAALRDPIPEGEYLDTLATRSGLTRVQIENFILVQSALHVELARQSIPVDFVLRRFRMLPSSGGRLSGPDADAQEIRSTLNYSIIVHPDEQDKVRVDCPLDKARDAGETGPRVESVRSRPNNTLKRYGVGITGGTEVNGDDFRHRRSDALPPTAQLEPVGGGTAIPLAVLDCTATRLVLGGAPDGTTGAYFLKITDADGHFTIYDQELTAA